MEVDNKNTTRKRKGESIEVRRPARKDKQPFEPAEQHHLLGIETKALVLLDLLKDNKDTSGRSYETYFNLISDFGDNLSLGSIKIKVITLRYESLEDFEKELQCAISAVHVCYGHYPEAQEHIGAVLQYLANCKLSYDWGGLRQGASS